MVTVADIPTYDSSHIDTTTPDLSHLEFMVPAVATEAQAAYKLGLDTITVSALQGLQFYWLAGYAGGWWPTYHPMCLAYPDLYKAGRIFSYAVNWSEDADWCDCEKGDLTVQQTLLWLPRQFARGHKRPGVYASLDTWLHGGLKDATDHYGPNIVRGVAWYTYNPTIAVPWADFQQYTDRYAGRNIDGNMGKDEMFVHGPPVINSLHYDWFPTGPFSSKRWGNLNERLVVEEYDGARQHSQKYKNYIPILQSQLNWLASRVYNVAHNPLGKDGKPTWGEFYRGWRFQQLIHRAHGQQFTSNPAAA
jgi:hypothetical protein